MDILVESKNRKGAIKQQTKIKQDEIKTSN